VCVDSKQKTINARQNTYYEISIKNQIFDVKLKILQILMDILYSLINYLKQATYDVSEEERERLFGFLKQVRQQATFLHTLTITFLSALSNPSRIKIFPKLKIFKFVLVLLIFTKFKNWICSETLIVFLKNKYINIFS
jgi:hypothetical protein